MTAEPSQFGRGVVVCLTKLSEHFADELAMTVFYLLRLEKDPASLDRARPYSITHPFGDDAKFYLHAMGALQVHEGKLGKAISRSISIWAYLAGDHLQELDRERAPRALVELADLVHRMGHHFGPEHAWTGKDWKRMRELWSEAALEVDRALGIPDADWGTT